MVFGSWSKQASSLASVKGRAEKPENSMDRFAPHSEPRTSHNTCSCMETKTFSSWWTTLVQVTTLLGRLQHCNRKKKRNLDGVVNSEYNMMVEHALLRNCLHPVCLIEVLPCSVLQDNLSLSTTLHLTSLMQLPTEGRTGCFWPVSGTLQKNWNHGQRLTEDWLEIYFTGTERLARALCSHRKRGEFGMLSVGGVEDSRWMDTVHDNICNPRGEQKRKVTKRNKRWIGEWCGQINWQKSRQTL